MYLCSKLDRGYTVQISSSVEIYHFYQVSNEVDRVLTWLSLVSSSNMILVMFTVSHIVLFAPLCFGMVHSQCTLLHVIYC